MATRCPVQHIFLCAQDTRWFHQALSWTRAAAADVSGLPWDSLVESTLVDFHHPVLDPLLVNELQLIIMNY